MAILGLVITPFIVWMVIRLVIGAVNEVNR